MLLDKLPSGTCPIAKPEHFAQASLGLLTEVEKRELEEHVFQDNCSDCLLLWPRVDMLIDELNLKKIQLVTTKPEKEKEIAEIKEVQNKLKVDFKHMRINLTLLVLCVTLVGFLIAFITKRIYDTPVSVNESVKIISASETTQNLYQQLDLAINNYLATSGTNYIQQAEKIAEKIEIDYQDKYGIDLVAYYKSLETKEFIKASALREELKQLEALPFSANDSESQLAKAQKIEGKFLGLGNILEAYRIKCIVIKLYMLTSSTNYETILDQGINYAQSNNYLFLKAHFLLWKAKAESNDVDELKAKQRLEEALAVSKKLQLNDTIPTITMSLAAVCQKHGENQKALIMAEDALKIPGTKYTTTISLMHIAAMASFQLSNYDKSDTYFHDAIAIAQKNNDLYYLSLSYSLVANFAIEKGNFRESQEILEKAESIATTVTNEGSRMYLMLTVKGYQGKSEFKQGRYLQASLFYKESLSNLEKIGMQANLRQASELNEGLALALDKTGSKDSVYYSSIARYFTRQLGTDNTQAMCFLSFAPNKCS